jgi:hypothetical protein
VGLRTCQPPPGDAAAPIPPKTEKSQDKLGDHHSRELGRETADAKAERIFFPVGILGCLPGLGCIFCG